MHSNADFGCIQQTNLPQTASASAFQKSIMALSPLSYIQIFSYNFN
jgi:hypothetical protein